MNSADTKQSMRSSPSWTSHIHRSSHQPAVTLNLTLTLSHSLCVSRYTQNHTIISGLTEGALQPSPDGIRSRCTVVVAVQVWIV